MNAVHSERSPAGLKLRGQSPTTTFREGLLQVESQWEELKNPEKLPYYLL